MNIFISNCKNCNKEFENKSGHRQRPRVYCSYECRRANVEKQRKESGYYAKRRKDPIIGPRIREQGLLYARIHPEVGRAWRKANSEKVKESVAKANSKNQGYPDEFHAIKYLVKGRDCNACVDCGEKRRGKLVVHHEDRNKFNNDMSNLFTLCIRCHGLRHRREFLLIRINPNQRGAYL